MRRVNEGLDHYLQEPGVELAPGFIDALKVAYDLIARHPQAGSLRFGYDLGLPELRSISLQRYPYIAFYRDQPDHIDVRRVLHGERDICPDNT
ncbi:type II toxin-antitoxin system RelE/ParE family toxin [Rhizobium lusitanum]|uniref:type II toxin-antitoxin system RelE/ParE family toxin n=1 Tax=Rhizobium lusitanum TaxID=293958 RepID=UPI001618D9A7|nr:type II toxin-antitoxin system RelE/ParE family toxin [Rhizobium lusitanum]